jgi:alpha-mannosidase
LSTIDTIYLIHHSHTDVGYTHDQPIVLELHTRFIDEALALAEQYASSDSDGAFRWTVENTYVLQGWLDRASDRDIERFVGMERAGRIEVTGMFANVTPLFDTDQLIESFQILRGLREQYGFTIQHAMNCDVNGENWPLVDVLLDLGIEGFTMAINSHFGGAFNPRPYPFLWEGPSGRSIPVFNGWPYDKGWREGIGRDADDFANVRWPRLQRYLEDIGYPLPVLMIQSYHPYGDNGSAFDFTPFIDQWNAAKRSPQIVMATPRMWWDAVKTYSDRLKTFRGDWTDFWNFGSISSAREQAINRRNRVRLRSADSLYAALDALPASGQPWEQQSFERYRELAWHSLHLWDEHTWGADISIRKPSSEDTLAQWHHKANYAYTARSLSLLLQRDGLAGFAQHVARTNTDDILVFNPLPWTRTISGPIPYYTTAPRGVSTDTTAGRHHQDRDGDGDTLLPPTQVPGFGYRVIPRNRLLPVHGASGSTDDAVVENHRYRVTFDRERGGIISLVDKQTAWEWVDRDAGYAFNGYVHESVADTTHQWPRHLLFHQDWHAPLADIPSGWQTDWQAVRAVPQRVLAHTVVHDPTGIRIVQQLDAPGCEGQLIQTIFLPDFADYVEGEALWEMGLRTHPEAAYIVFPFNVPDAVARFDLGGQSVIAGTEQLPGVCRDYFTVQGWVDFSNQERGVTIALPENPMVQLGDFHFGHYQSDFKLGRAMLLGWVTNNYWETNFRARQPGTVFARYRILPHIGIFDEAQAHQFGLEAANAELVVQHVGELGATPTTLPESGSLLILPGEPILTLHIKATRDQSGMLVRLLNASDTPQTAQITSGLLAIVRANQCDLLENVLDELPVRDGTITVEVGPRQIVVVQLTVK